MRSQIKIQQGTVEVPNNQQESRRHAALGVSGRLHLGVACFMGYYSCASGADVLTSSNGVFPFFLTCAGSENLDKSADYESYPSADLIRLPPPFLSCLLSFVEAFPAPAQLCPACCMQHFNVGSNLTLRESSGIRGQGGNKEPRPRSRRARPRDEGTSSGS